MCGEKYFEREGELKMDNQSVRHFLAALSYRFAKTVQDAPQHFPSIYIGKGVRTPIEIVNHMSHVLRFALNGFEKSDLGKTDVLSCEEEVQCFDQTMEQLDGFLSRGLDPQGVTLEQIVQGPVSDAMTHVGQLALLRRMADSSILGENFMAADIQVD